MISLSVSDSLHADNLRLRPVVDDDGGVAAAAAAVLFTFEVINGGNVLTGDNGGETLDECEVV